MYPLKTRRAQTVRRRASNLCVMTIMHALVPLSLTHWHTFVPAA